MISVLSFPLEFPTICPFIQFHCIYPFPRKSPICRVIYCSPVTYDSALHHACGHVCSVSPARLQTVQDIPNFIQLGAFGRICDYTQGRRDTWTLVSSRESAVKRWDIKGSEFQTGSRPDPSLSLQGNLACWQVQRSFGLLEGRRAESVRSLPLPGCVPPHLKLQIVQTPASLGF